MKIATTNPNVRTIPEGAPITVGTEVIVADRSGREYTFVVTSIADDGRVTLGVPDFYAGLLSAREAGQ